MLDPTPHAASWQALLNHHRRISKLPKSHLFPLQDANAWAEREAALVLDLGALRVDFTRQRMDTPVMRELLRMAELAPVAQMRDMMFGEAILNPTEHRPVTHWRWRDPNAPADIKATRARMFDLADRIRSGAFRIQGKAQVTDVLHLGIGGSFLGPLMVEQTLAYTAQAREPIRAHFAANVDGHELQSVLANLDPHTTLISIASKTFTTRETMQNTHTVLEWVRAAGIQNPGAQCVALTSANDKAMALGVPEAQIFGFDEGVGGRFSLWSPIGFPLILALGSERWSQLLEGAHAADAHFREAPFERNLPVLLALVDAWNHSVGGLTARCMAPYDARLRYLIQHLQQLEMESLGKSLNTRAEPALWAHCPMVWGEPGTNGQHAYFQWMHQGVAPVAIDLMFAVQQDHAFPDHHRILLANALAQADAFAFGQNAQTSDDDPYAVFKHLPGGKPVTVWALRRLDAYTVGFMLATFEHKVSCLGVLWDINAYDQFGVELGKVMAKAVEGYLGGHSAPPLHMQGLFEWMGGMP